MISLQKLDKQIYLLVNNILDADFRGFDPYDILELLATIPDKQLGFLLHKSARIANRVVPLPTRLLFRIKPQLNPKALGLCLRTFALLHEKNSDCGRWRAAADRALELLLENRSKNYAMSVWGYPFDWRSRILIPKGTPSAVVNSIIADGLMEWFRVSGEDRFLEMSCGICDFFVQHLNRSYGNGDSLCFSYTPIDNFHVHNANLFVAETLVKVGMVVGKSDWIELGKRAAYYALKDQKQDGSISYWASDQIEAGSTNIDHYHSGFEIRTLYRIARVQRDQKLKSAADRYFAFYKKNLLYTDGNLVMPKDTPDRVYPVDIHSCAELMILNSELAIEDKASESYEILKLGSNWIFENMLDKKSGQFYSRIEDCSLFKLHVKIPYMRWNMAWMLLALVLCRKCLTKHH